jgi:hypothetical protein
MDVSLGIWNGLEIKEQAVCLAYVVYGSDITFWLALANQPFVVADLLLLDQLTTHPTPTVLVKFSGNTQSSCSIA